MGTRAGGSWRPATWNEVKEDDPPSSGPSRIFVTFEGTGLGGLVNSHDIALRTNAQPPPA